LNTGKFPLLPSAKIHKQTLNFTMSSHKAKSDIDAESDGNGKGSATDDVPTPMRALSKRFIELVKKPAWATDAKLFWPGAIILTRLYAHARASIKCSLADAVREFLTELNLVTATPFDKIDPDNVNWNADGVILMMRPALRFLPDLRQGRVSHLRDVQVLCRMIGDELGSSAFPSEQLLNTFEAIAPFVANTEPRVATDEAIYNHDQSVHLCAQLYREVIRATPIFAYLDEKVPTTSFELDSREPEELENYARQLILMERRWTLV
jgi:hypothetical protein